MNAISYWPTNLMSKSAVGLVYVCLYVFLDNIFRHTGLS